MISSEWKGLLAQSSLMKQFSRFLAVGMINTAFGYGVFAAGLYLTLPPELALLAATFAGIAFNFMTTGRLVFATNRPRSLPRFLVVYAVAYIFNVLGLKCLGYVGAPPLYAQLLLLPIMVVGTFISMRSFVFQEQNR